MRYRETWLRMKVFAICILRHLKIIKNVWHKSEFELAQLVAKRESEFFNKEE